MSRGRTVLVAPSLPSRCFGDAGVGILLERDRTTLASELSHEASRDCRGDEGAKYPRYPAGDSADGGSDCVALDDDIGERPSELTRGASRRGGGSVKLGKLVAADRGLENLEDGDSILSF